jgi:AcrR family transcriptional regulator
VVGADGPTPTARELLWRSAERLIAEQGPAIPLRQVVAAAGQRNSAAVHYHFGSREGLIDAIVQARQADLERERLALLSAYEAQGRTDLRALVEVLLLPVFAQQRAEHPSFHARFLEKVRDLPGIVAASRDRWPATTLVVHRLERALRGPDAGGPAPSRHRLRAVLTVVVALLADLERTPFSDDDERRAAEAETVTIVLGVLGAIAAPG